MPDASNLLSSLYQRGVKIWIEHGRVRFRARKGTLLPSDLTELHRLKSELVVLLTEAQAFAGDCIQRRPPGSPIMLPDGYLSALRYLFEKESRLSTRDCVTSVRILGALNVQLLRACVRYVVDCHESLRIQFVMLCNVPTMRVGSTPEDILELIDLSRTSAKIGDEEIRQLAQTFAATRIDISAEPLFAFRIFRISENEHVMVSAFEHLISDAISVEIVSRQIWTLYGQAAQGLPCHLPKHLPQFPDYLIWLKNTHDAWKDVHEAYWKQLLADAPATEIPLDNVAEVMRPAIAVDHISFGETLSTSLREIARRQGTTPSLAVLAIYTAVMSHWCSQSNLVMQIVANARFLPELESTTGCILDLLPIRAEVDRKHTFTDLLSGINEAFYTATHHRGSGFRSLIQESTTELYFNWTPPPFGAPYIPGGISLQPFTFMPLRTVRPGTAKFHPIFYETASGISVLARYRTDRLAPSTVARFGRNLRVFASAIVQRPNARIESISLEIGQTL